MATSFKSCSLRVLLLLGLLCPAAVSDLPAQSKELKRATLDLKKSIGREDPEGFLEAFTAVLATGERRAIKIAVDAYVEFAKDLGAGVETSGKYYFLHSKAANAFKDAKGKYVTKEIEKIRKNKRGDWRGRLLILDAACFKSDLDLEAACLDFRNVQQTFDESSQVVAAAFDDLHCVPVALAHVVALNQQLCVSQYRLQWCP